MTLKIKHLMPYLAYKLKFLDLKCEPDDNISIMEALDVNGAISDNCGNIDIKLNEIKPILSPISDLEKLIKTEFDKLDELRMSNYTSEIIDLFCYENTGTDENISEINLEKLPYECVEYMFKYHYDFFGLIEKGLAIDKNTLL